MNCDPDTLAADAKCLCFPDELADAVSIYLLCVIADAWPEP